MFTKVLTEKCRTQEKKGHLKNSFDIINSFEKMKFIAKIISFSTFLKLIDLINSVELTFELPDNSKECFYQEVGKNRSAVLEYQVTNQRIEKC